MKATIALLIIGMILFLWGCGEDAEETVSVEIPILLKNVTDEGTYALKVTIRRNGL